jgi:nitrogen fixation protein FixH
MKINWGKGIAIAIVLFVSFIMYFVITMTTDHRYDHDLVTENYYKNELTYQEKIDASRNVLNLSSEIVCKSSADGIAIVLPKELQHTELHGKVFLYRPSDKQLDFELTFSESTNYLLVPDNRLLDGRWNISVEIRHENKDYFFKEEIIY